MFKKIREAVTSMMMDAEPVDPSQFDDPVAMQTEWTPARKGGANFRTHTLVQVRADRMAFKATVGMKLFASLFLIIGLAAGIGLPFAIAQTEGASPVFWLFPIVVGTVFTGGGIYMWVSAATPRVFDKSVRYFWKSRKSPEVVFGGQTSPNWALLAEIHALQVLAEQVKGKNRTYYSFELNLVLPDGRRLMVVDHGNYKKLRADAETLSEFLGVPIWDAG